MDKQILKFSIILIGPMHVGMDMVAKSLSEQTGLPIVDVNSLRKIFYPKFGYNIEVAKKKKRESNISWMEYQKQYECKLATYVLTMFLTKPSIVCFGAGFSVYEDKNLFSEVQKAMQPYKNVINLELPVNYMAYNKAACSEENKKFVHNNCNYILSKFDVTVDCVDRDLRTNEFIFSEYKFKNIIDNIITISGNKRKK